MAEILNNCCICNKNSFKHLFYFRNFPIVKCQHCTLIYSALKPSSLNIKKIYEDDGSYPQGTKLRPFANKLRIKWISLFCKKGKLLEVGCGDGGLLEVAQNTGRYKIKGVEINRKAVEYANKFRDLDVVVGTVFEQNFGEGEFDGVIMWHVIEHLENPLNELKEVYRITRNNGYVFISTPNVSHPKAIVAGKKWHYFGPPGHLWYFSPKTLALLVEKAGFKVKIIWKIYSKAHLTLIAKKQ